MGTTRRRTHQLALLEARLTRPKRIALYGHCNVGKTTLLAMFYREASSGRIPGIRVAAADAGTAQYLAEQIARLESGQPTLSSRSERDLKLTLYHGPARLELLVRDYQGEHVELGTEEPIQQFFADCDGVFLCVDPEGSTDPAQRRRRQQEIENLLERYIARSEDLDVGRPVALLLTKFDRVLTGAASPDSEPGLESRDSTERVERLVDARYAMTRHALAAHAARSAIFAVSSFGPGAHGDEPPATLSPFGLDGPLCWLAEQLEAQDRADIQCVSSLAANDLSRLARCVATYDRRYPRSNESFQFRADFKALKRKRLGTWALRSAALCLVALGALAGWELVASQRAQAFDWARGTLAPALAERCSALLHWHPSLPGRSALHEFEQTRARARHDARWKTVRAEAGSLAAMDDPERALAAIDGFLREFPATPHRSLALDLARSLKEELGARRFARERRLVDDLVRSETLKNPSLPELIERARRFLADHPDSALRAEVEGRLQEYIKRVDTLDIESARSYSRQYPARFAERIEHYQEYLKAHQSGGLFVREALEAKDQVLREWDDFAYRQAYEYALARPDDVADVARRLRQYLHDHPDGRHAAMAQQYLDWWDTVSVPSQYRVTLHRGEVEPYVGKFLAGGGPDLGVIIEVAGSVYGPSAVCVNSRRPIWDYTFAQPITWKLNDPITIRIVDYDWSARQVYALHSRQSDPLAIRLLSGTIKPDKGGRTTLVFSSDFAMPALSPPE
jgi:hypothetical protein